MKKQRLFLLSLAALLLFLLVQPVVHLHNRQLKQAVTALADGDVVTLEAVVPFAWDAVYTFDPYTSREEMEADIGFRSRALRESVSEGMVQLVFVKGSRVTASVCAYPSALGYSVFFSGTVLHGTYRPFTVAHEAGIVRLSPPDAA